jgi:hypothetical protein
MTSAKKEELSPKRFSYHKVYSEARKDEVKWNTLQKPKKSLFIKNELASDKENNFNYNRK